MGGRKVWLDWWMWELPRKLGSANLEGNSGKLPIVAKSGSKLQVKALNEGRS